MFIPQTSSGVLTIPDKYIFVDTAERDNYFIAHPSELTNKRQVAITSLSVLQQYNLDIATWEDVSAIFRGPTGATGADGAKGDDGEGVPTGGLTNQLLVKQSNADYETEWATLTPGTAISISDTTVSVNLGTGHTEAAYGNHNHSGIYEPIISVKNSAFNVDFGTGYSNASRGSHDHNTLYEPIISVKNTAFNKDFGTTHTSVAYGDHEHDEYVEVASIGIGGGVAPLNSSAYIDPIYLPSSITGAVTYQGTFDPSGGVDPTPKAKGNYFVASNGGTLSTVLFATGDWLVYRDTTNWDKVGNSSGSVVWTNISGKPLSFTPSEHNNSAHSETYITADGVTYENLSINGDIGTGATQVSQGNHDHNTAYLGLFATASNSELLDGHDSTYFATTGHGHDATYQPLDGDLTAIAAISGTSGLLKKTATDTWSLDTSTYATTGSLSNYMPTVVAGTTGNVLTSNGSSWISSTPAISLPSGIQGNIIYHNGSAWATLAPSTSGYVLSTQGVGANPTWVAQSGGGTTVKVSSNDSTAGYLNGKLVAGTNITLTEGTDGGNETLTISASGSGGSSTPFVLQRAIEGNVYTTTLMYWVAPATYTIQSTNMYLAAEPSGNNSTDDFVRVDIRRNGNDGTNTIYNTGYYLNIHNGSSAVNGVFASVKPYSATEFATQTINSGDVVFMTVTSVGVTTPGADLLVEMKLT